MSRAREFRSIHTNMLMRDPPDLATARYLAESMSKQEIRYFRQASRQVLGVDSPTILGLTHHAYCQLSDTEAEAFRKRHGQVIKFCEITLNGDTPYRYGRKRP